MAVESIPNPAVLNQAFQHEICSSDGSSVKFGSLFGADDHSTLPTQQVLVIFIRHFFCGNCQEYIRRLSSAESPFHPSQKTASTTNAHSTTNSSKVVARSAPAVIVIGPGLPSLIKSYANVTQCPYPIYSDPSTRLYDMLGMYRTLSLGDKAPEYIQHSLLAGAVKSAWQIVRRVGTGDAMGGGDWHVNGGEFVFVRTDQGHGSLRREGFRSASSSKPVTVQACSMSRGGPATGSQINDLGWEVDWCHRMLNSRDHTEIHDLQYHTNLSKPSAQKNVRGDPPPRTILVNHKPRAQSDSSLQNYSSACRGSCPGPDIPRYRDEVLLNQTAQRPHSRLTSTPRSRSSSISSTLARTPPVLTRARTASGSESRDSNILPDVPEPHARASSPIVEEQDESKPRKSFTANIVDHLEVLMRAKSTSARSARSKRKASIGGIFHSGSTSLNLSRHRPHSRVSDFPSDPSPKSSNYSRPGSRSSTRSRSPSESLQKTSPHPPTIKRARTFSLSRVSMKKGAAKIDENGVMLVDGVEFVNVIAVKARIERVDSGIGHVDNGALAQR